MSYSIRDLPGGTKFVLERLDLDGNGVFTRLDSTKAESDLYWLFCENKDPLQIPIDHLITAKSKYSITNDPPPPIFCAAFLWQHLVPFAISEFGYEPDFRPVNSYTPTEFSLSTLQKWADERWCPDVNNTFSLEWLRSGLEFLTQADLAALPADGSDCVIVRLQRAIGGRVHESSGALSGVASDLAERYARCTIRRRIESQEKASRKSDPLQQELDLWDIPPTNAEKVPFE